jgi:hydroxypyruvate reductase
MAGVRAVEPGRAVTDHLSLRGGTLIAGEEEISLSPSTRIFVVGAGKAGAPMAAAVEKVLGGLVHKGLVVVKYDHLAPLRKVLVREAAHPVPDEGGLAASVELMDLLKDTGAEDVVICLLSGGGSALLPSPAPPVTLADKQIVTIVYASTSRFLKEAVWLARLTPLVSSR